MQPLERGSKGVKTSGYRRCCESNQRFIISSAALIGRTAAYCHCFVLVSRCKTLTPSNQAGGGGGVGPKHPAGSAHLNGHTSALSSHRAEHRLGRSRMNADDFMPTREIDAVCAAMIDLKDSFKIRTECMQTQP